MKNKNGIAVQEYKGSYSESKRVEGYKKKVNGVIVEIFAEPRNIQSNKMITNGWKPIYE